MNPERGYAAEQLLSFLKHVGPIEAVWALTTALEELQDLTPGADHVAAADLALKESLAEFEELAALPEVPPAGDPVIPPPADPEDGKQGGEALVAETPAPEAPKKTGRAS